MGELMNKWLCGKEEFILSGAAGLGIKRSPAEEGITILGCIDLG